MDWQKFYASDAIAWSLKETVNNIRLALLSMLILLGEMFASVIVLGIPSIIYTLRAMPGLKNSLYTSNTSWFMCNIAQAQEFCMKLSIHDIPTSVIVLWSFVFFILAMLGSMFSAGYLRMLIKFHDSGTAEIRQMFLGWHRGPRIFIAGLIVLSGFIIGMVFFIIPGIYILIHAILYPFFIVDKDTGIVQSIKKSFKTVQGHSWQVGTLVLLAMLVSINPIVKLLSGFPLMLMLIYAYRRLA
jgi:uncharacterized membrane protein